MPIAEARRGKTQLIAASSAIKLVKDAKFDLWPCRDCCRQHNKLMARTPTLFTQNPCLR